jgi:hypothetical protein
MTRTSSNDDVRGPQLTIYRAAKADAGRCLDTFCHKICRREVKARAWAQVRRNDDAAGVERMNQVDVEKCRVSRVLEELGADPRGGRNRPHLGRR